MENRIHLTRGFIMIIKNYKKNGEVIDFNKVKLEIPIIYEIIKKYVTRFELENM